MSYYQKFRPHQFSDILGQDEVIAILKSQSCARQFHHSYLCFGTSGTGKTTSSRVLAMAINCTGLNGDGEPCGKCYSCQAIISTSHPDVIEVDGARFRGVDDIRELIYRAYLGSFTGGKKIYIIDEVHALTADSFNTLLRLLEEPPPHVIIIMATTHFEKLPDTLTSRCMLLPFSPLKASDIKTKLNYICEKEGVKVDQKNIDRIAENSCGNCRKAENALEELSLLSATGVK